MVNYGFSKAGTVYITIIFSELYLRWIVDQKNSEWTATQIQELITSEKELRAKVIL